jgi:hypothetical protein
VEEDTRGLRSVRGGELRVPLVCCHTSADLSQQHDLDVFQQVPRTQETSLVGLREVPIGDLACRPQRGAACRPQRSGASPLLRHLSCVTSLASPLLPAETRAASPLLPA